MKRVLIVRDVPEAEAQAPHLADPIRRIFSNVHGNARTRSWEARASSGCLLLSIDG